MAPRIVLVGMPGAGKSKIGLNLAKRWGIPFADTDELISSAEGRSVAEIFGSDGESEFRRIEERVVHDALESFDGVLSLGGGAVLSEATRRALRDHTVVYLDAEDDCLVERVDRGKVVRPLLQDDPAGGIKRLREERAGLYHQVAKIRVDSTNFSVGQAVDTVQAKVEAAPIRVDVKSTAEYPVYIGHGLVDLAVHYGARAASALIVHSPDVAEYADRIRAGLTDAQIPAASFELLRGESAKTSAVLADAWDAAADAGIGRDGVIIAVGGGATTDLAGFVAASWLRGVPVIQVPTSLLAMVDAAVGGKTGINTKHGKNLVGAFHHPQVVLCDMDVLATLPRAELRAGLGEVVKCGFIADSEILAIVQRAGQSLLDPTNPDLLDVVERSIRVKAEVVGSDFTEQGIREYLNYGHTLAHAIELNENFTMRHGEAVAIGCVFAAELAEAEGVAEPGLANLHRGALEAVGLPTSYSGTSREALTAAMHTDKKVRCHQLRFVVLSQIGSPEILVGPHKLDQAFDAIGVS